MNVEALILRIAGHYVGEDYKDIVQRIGLWLENNKDVLREVGEDLLDRAAMRVFADKQQSVAEVEKIMAGLSWPERLEILKNGVKKINAQTSLRKKELAVLVSVLELSIELLPYLLMVL